MCQNNFTKEEEELLISLDSFGYPEAAETVYGCKYEEWKEVHQRKATDEQINNFNSSSSIHAKHDKKMLETGGGGGVGNVEARLQPSPSPPKQQPQSHSTSSPWTPKVKAPTPSDVCCEDGDMQQSTLTSTRVPFTRVVSGPTGFRPPPPPRFDLSLKIGILTISDRAAAGEYETGDLSGPAVEQALAANIGNLNSRRAQSDQTTAMINFIAKAIVPDDIDEIKQRLTNWSGSGGNSMDIIFTTGGTGFSSRDITPEATLQVIERECSGLMAFVAAECASIQPLAALSRGIAGICNRTIIVNLPGNPNGVGGIIDVLFPLLLHAVKDLKSE